MSSGGNESEETGVARIFAELKASGLELLKTGKKNLPVALEVSELADMGQTAARLTILAEDLTDEERSRHRLANDEIKGVRARAKAVSQVLASGVDERPVEVRIFADFAHGRIALYRGDTGAMVHEEAMDPKLRQLMFDNDVERRLRSGEPLPRLDLSSLQVILDKPEAAGTQQVLPLPTDKAPNVDDMPPITEPERELIKAGRVLDALAGYKARTGIKAKHAKIRLMHDEPWDADLPPAAPEPSQSTSNAAANADALPPEAGEPAPSSQSPAEGTAIFPIVNTGSPARYLVQKTTDGQAYEDAGWVGCSFGALKIGTVFVVEDMPAVYVAISTPKYDEAQKTWTMDARISAHAGPDDNADPANGGDDPPPVDLDELTRDPNVERPDDPKESVGDFDPLTPEMDEHEAEQVRRGNLPGAQSDYRKRTGKDLKTSRRAAKRVQDRIDREQGKA